jgi:hypothetical protein
MSRVLITVKLDPGKATLAEVCKRLRLAKSDLDESFGVVSIDPRANLFAVLVEESALPDAKQHADVSGPYSNPRIEGLGPPASSG